MNAGTATLFFIFSWYLLGIAIMAIAKTKGRNPLLWFLYGFFLFPIALFHAVAMSSRRTNPQIDALMSKVSDLTHAVERLTPR